MQAQELPHAVPRRLTRAEYDQLGELGFFQRERVELIRGIVVRMSPIGPSHSDVVDVLNALLVRRLGDRARVRIQQPFLAWDDSEPEPDVAVVPAKSYAESHPDQAHLIIEVAETSLDYDRETKGPLFAASSVPEYWIVDVRARTIEMYTQPAAGRYARMQRIAVGESVAPRTFPDATIAVAELFPR